MTCCLMIKGKNIRKSRCVRCSFEDFNRFKINHTYSNDIDEQADFFFFRKCIAFKWKEKVRGQYHALKNLKIR